jgi:hypothetical protein
MHAEAAVWQARIRKEFDNRDLCVRWNGEMCRYQVGQRLREGASEHIDWFYTVTDGNSGFRPLDWRLLRKLHSLDKTKQTITAAQLRRQIADAREAAEDKRGEERKYRLRSEAQFMSGRWGL